MRRHEDALRLLGANLLMLSEGDSEDARAIDAVLADVDRLRRERADVDKALIVAYDTTRQRTEQLRAAEQQRDEARGDARVFERLATQAADRADRAERWSTSLLPLVHATRDGIASGRLGKHLEHGCLCSLHQLLDRFTAHNDDAEPEVQRG